MQDNNNFNPEEEDEQEQFSEDPEEQLRIENDLLRLKIQVETGTNIHDLDDIPAEVENMFLHHILAFERQQANQEDESVYAILGEPRQFRKESELNDTEIEAALDELQQYLSERNFVVIFIATYPARLKYRFITEELFLHRTTRVDFPEMVNHFIYEEFHPNHELLLSDLTEDFLGSWMGKDVDGLYFLLGAELRAHCGEAEISKICPHIRNVLDAYQSFENGSFDITEIECRTNDDGEPEGKARIQGNVYYDAILENGDTQNITGSFRLQASYEIGFWEICSFSLPCLTIE
jgi:hypothetical protein